MSSMQPGTFRLFLALLVVIHHSFPLRLGAWAVGMFFALSGFWISRMWRRKYAKLDAPYTEFLASRWWRLAPVFLTVHLIAVILTLSGYRVGNPAAISDWRWVVTQPLIAGSTQVTRLLPPSWSLDVEMQFYLCAPLLVVGMASLSKRDAGCFVLALLCWSVLRLCIIRSFEEAKLDIFAWIFAVGCLCERFDFHPTPGMVTASATTVGCLILLTFGFTETHSLVWLRGSQETTAATWLQTGYFVLLVSAGIPFAMDTVGRRSSPWDRWLGDLSYPLYMFHWLPREWYYAHVDLNGPWWHSLTMLGVNITVALGGAVVILQLVDRPLQNLRSRRLASSLPNTAPQPNISNV
ncbi:acyltransferase family protein [Rhodopirellula sallentina]|uniref:Acyltransferase 3 n=1 Tax=Rhodopirellula sallentina SM41 TaxID=1263870 RepID=M5UKC5_9BACT|nr:acyltransferase [Rhodopirellula sallentina]EMI56478.1 acyltransferase 3 [Rhodopirellula sallentina SM41]